MSTIPGTERIELIRLLRGLSPRGLAAAAPALRGDLEALVLAVLPRRPRAIFFDVYGTLLVSAAGAEPASGTMVATEGGRKAQSLLEAGLTGAGYEGGALPFAQAVSRLIEEDRGRRLALTQHPEVDIEALVARLLPGAPGTAVRRLGLLLEAARNPCAPMPGALALLKRLRAGAIRLGLVSNAQFYTPLLIEALFGQPAEALGFEAGLSAFSFEEGIAKPDPALFLRAASPLLESGMAPGDILVVGNSSANDIVPARALGFMAVLFAGDARSFRPSPPGSPAAPPDSLLGGFDDFEAILPATG